MSLHDFYDRLYEEHGQCCRYPSPAVVSSFFDDLLGLLFPELSDRSFDSREAFATYIDEIRDRFCKLVGAIPGCKDLAEDTHVDDFMQALPEIKIALQYDVKALLQGDPAAKSTDEVIRTYPGFYALAAHRIAHQIWVQDIEILPRAISELAHSKTGIDIHPGASIGSHCCIDHGTGVVIGETVIIGNHVKIYQGVTLGALSVSKEDADAKRHPTIEDHVTLYAGATILGGDTVIGAHSIIGGNVWLTRSVAPHSTIYYKTTMATSTIGNVDTLIHRTD